MPEQTNKTKNITAVKSVPAQNFGQTVKQSKTKLLPKFGIGKYCGKTVPKKLLKNTSLKSIEVKIAVKRC